MTLTRIARILTRRSLGKITFVTAKFNESTVQLVFKNDSTQNYSSIGKIPIGSLIEVTTVPTTTKQDKSARLVTDFDLVHRVTDLLPDKHKGLSRTKRYGDERSIDLIINESAFNLVTFMSLMTMNLRIALSQIGFKEFNTGILQRYFEGGYAQPFTVTGNASGLEYSLSLTSELKLKRLIIAGFERVFEITQSFRNEGMDSIHSPEFTLLELYQVGISVEEIALLLEEIIISTALATQSEATFKASEQFNLLLISLQKKFHRKSFFQLFSKYMENGVLPNLNSLVEHYPDSFHVNMTKATWVIKVLEKFIAPNIHEPTFITDIPSGISPLVRNKEEDQEISKRYFFAFNQSLIADLYEDENDLNAIEAAMERQSVETKRPINTPYLNTLQYGIPQTSGIGMGLNRLYMAFLPSFGLEQNIKETLIFPF